MGTRGSLYARRYLAAEYPGVATGSGRGINGARTDSLPSGKANAEHDLATKQSCAVLEAFRSEVAVLAHDRFVICVDKQSTHP